MALALQAPELALVVPTLNERGNIEPLLELVGSVLGGVAWEVIFVDDDSRDGTAEAVRAIALRDPRVRCLQRIGRRGLSTACIEGVLASAAPYVPAMDADLQHDQRLHGESKLDTLVAWEFGMLLADKLVGHLVPVRFALFAFIGLLGLGVHLLVLRTALGLPTLSFAAAQGVATMVAMTSNFFLNNLFTYRDQRLRGWRLVRGLVSFYLICSVGAVGNVGIAAYVFAIDNVWWLAGIAGAVVGSVWNYAVSAVFTWRGK